MDFESFQTPRGLRIGSKKFKQQRRDAEGEIFACRIRLGAIRVSGMRFENFIISRRAFVYGLLCLAENCSRQLRASCVSSEFE